MWVSVVGLLLHTMLRCGRSVCGLIKKFYRVECRCHCFTDFVIVTWFPLPNYPDGDPLTIQIVLPGLDVNNVRQVDVVPLYAIHPSRIGVETHSDHDYMCMLRVDGTDTMPN